ncbi:protein PHOTOSYSTEM I ASSEMBLY 2, chloroplastic isoform X2 [Cornus florida]|uniref:protein PHOTOSYSTEM I ASSEMBLY 2, chloroplastic isoform X2 n=1 Tax=Cornus florida TaxID=4283 RepID=UPI00289A6501|nr:protein PHOTOSYSTEM I ASSEMBLY 2, chloroplastic isoform X2 [Cornus florida]
MAKLFLCCDWKILPELPVHAHFNTTCTIGEHKRGSTLIPFAANSFSLNSIGKRCQKCAGKGAIECPGCKGTGKNKKNGNIFERWKCFDCQGFGLKSCPSCGKGGLTPEQRGER